MHKDTHKIQMQLFIIRDILLIFEKKQQVNFVQELKWRGMIHDIMPGTEEQFNKDYIYFAQIFVVFSIKRKFAVTFCDL